MPAESAPNRAQIENAEPEDVRDNHDIGHFGLMPLQQHAEANASRYQLPTVAAPEEHVGNQDASNCILATQTPQPRKQRIIWARLIAFYQTSKKLFPFHTFL